MRKRNKKLTMTTVLVLGEGETELAFLKHIKLIYGQRGNGKSTTPESAGGKGPDYILKRAIRKSADYDRTLVLMDTDNKWPKGLVDEAEKKKIILIGSEPCIEGFFLSLLESKKKYNSLSSPKCKDRFHRDFLNEKHKVDPRKYAKIFSKKVCEVLRKKSKNLDKIIKMIE